MGSKDPKRDVKVYVGNLPPDVREREVEDLFAKYGRISFIDLKIGGGRRNPFCFVEYEDHRDAEDAVRGRDGYNFEGRRLKVEFTTGVGPRGPGGRPMFGDDDRGRNGNYRGRSPSRGGGGGRRGTGYRVMVSGLPNSGSWQDLKDHMREAGDVLKSDVYKDGTGMVEYLRYDDMKYAIKKLDDTKFKSHEGETSYIRVREADDRDDARGSRGGGSGRDRSRSPRGRRDSPKYSPRGGSRSRSRSF